MDNKDREIEEFFQFFLISTFTQHVANTRGALSVLPYFDFYGFVINRNLRIFQFFLISTSIAPALGLLMGLSVLPYFD